MRRNPQRTVFRVWLAITAVASAGVFLPSALGMDGMRGGYALAVLSGFLALVGLVTLAFYAKRARTYESILRAPQPLLQWTVPDGLWRNFLRADYEEDRRAMRGLFGLMLAVSLVVGAALLAALPDKGVVAAIVAGIIALTGLTSRLAPWMRYRRNRDARGEVRLAAEGILVGRAFHAWNSGGARLENVETLPGSPAMLALTYSFPTRQGRQTWTVRAPVPSGREEDAARAALELKRRNGL